MSELHGQSWGSGPVTVLAIHGITASSAAWSAVAAALPESWRLVAPDLAGRGHSRDLPGPWGLRRHVADVCDLAAELGPCVLLGHSMGAYVASLAAAERPQLFEKVVLVDGGIPLPMSEGVDPDEVLAATLGPALARLRETYADQDAYVDFFRAHPALGPHWNDTIEAYVRYDSMPTGNGPTGNGPTGDGVRSRALEEAVRQDGRELLVHQAEFDAALRAAQPGTRLLVAPMGMFGEPPGLLPAEAVAAYGAEVANLSVETVPDVNHYTILFDPAAAARVAAAATA
ncbi:MAG: alpha/beta hydrolase [Nocardioides sp.]